MTTTLTLSTDTHFILMREYSAIESMEICKIKCTIVRVKVKGFWLLNLQLKKAKNTKLLKIFGCKENDKELKHCLQDNSNMIELSEQCFCCK